MKSTVHTEYYEYKLRNRTTSTGEIIPDEYYYCIRCVKLKRYEVLHDDGTVGVKLKAAATCSEINGIPVTDFSSFLTLLGMEGLNEDYDELDITEVDLSKAESLEEMFYVLNLKGLRAIVDNNFNIAKCKTMRSMFASLGGLKSITLIGGDYSTVLDMTSMFTECCNLENINLTSIYTASPIYSSYMFSGAGVSSTLGGSIEFSSKFVSRLQNASHMFYESGFKK